MRRPLRTVACAVALTSLAGTTAWASGGGTPRWIASYEHGAPAYSTAVELSPAGSTVYVTGTTRAGESGRLATLAYDASSGDQRWVATIPNGDGGLRGLGRALAASPDGSALFVTGFSRCDPGCDNSNPGYGWATVAYNASTGDRLWTSRFATSGGQPRSIEVTPDGSTVLVAGKVLTGDQAEYEFSEIVAYDSSTGETLWRVRRERGAGYDDGGLSVSPDGATVFMSDTAPADNVKCYRSGGYRTTALKTVDGTVEWSSTYQVTDGGSYCGTSTDLALSADGSAVYVTGFGSSSPVGHSSFDRVGTVAYDAESGTRLWATDPDIRLSGGTAAQLGVSPDGSKVFTSGADCRDLPCLLATAAHDTSTGDQLWASQYDGGGRVAYLGDLAVSPDGSSVFITGEVKMHCFAGCWSSETRAPLVAYDTATGDLQWATAYTDNLGVALAVSPDSSSVYLAGTFTAAASTSSKETAARAARACSDVCGYSTARVNTGPGPGTFQDPDPALRYNGWRGFFHKTAVGGTYRASNVTGDTAILRTPKVTSVTWLTRQGPNHGKAKVIIDGRSRGVFNLYSPTPSARTVRFDGLARKAHTVKVKVLGRKGPSSNGTWVGMDGFRFRAGIGIAEESSAKLQYDSWTGRSKGSGGSLRMSGSRDARVGLNFEGQTIKWITATGPAFGRARVVIDGKAHTVDLYRPTWHARVAITYTGLPKGKHHIMIRPLGRKDRDSRSTNVVVDAFVVRR